MLRCEQDSAHPSTLQCLGCILARNVLSNNCVIISGVGVLGKN